MISIPRYRARLSQLSGEAYNLPVDTIYYIESGTDSQLDRIVRDNSEEIAYLLNDRVGEDRILPYRFRYVSRCDVGDLRQLISLHPEIDHVDPDLLQHLRIRYDAREIASLSALSDDAFRDSFICHLLPGQNNPDNTCGFYSIDISETSLDNLLDVLTDYVRALNRYNREILLDRMDYTRAGQVEQKSVDDPAHDTFPMLDRFEQKRRREDERMLAMAKRRKEIREFMERKRQEEEAADNKAPSAPAPPAPGIRFSVSKKEAEPRTRNAGSACCGAADSLGVSESRKPSKAKKRLTDLFKKESAPEPKPEEPKRPTVEMAMDILQDDYRYMAPDLDFDLCDAAPMPHASACRIPSPEERLNEELRRRADAIRQQIEELQRQNGINIWSEMLYAQIIQQLRGEQPVPVSRLRIDPQFRILLPEYDIKIHLSTLPMALYVLFLRHPEGIDRYDLESHREELRTIYLTLSGRDDVTAMNRSIDDLVTPGSDSLNQKVSRINAAFRNRLATDVAQPYLIQGPRGEKKRVEVAGSVELPDELRF